MQGVVNGIWGFLSIYLLDIGGTGLEVGILATVPGIAATFMQLSWGRISDKLSHSWRMASTGFLFTAIFSIPVIFSNQPWQVIIATGVQALFSSISGIAVVVKLADSLRPSKRGKFMGVYNPMGFAGNIVGSSYAGFIIPLAGYKFTFLTYTLINIIIASLVRYGLSKKDEKMFRLSSLMKDSLLELNNGIKQLPAILKRGGTYTRWCFGVSIRGFGISMFSPVLIVFLVQGLNLSKPQIGALNSLAFGLRLVLSPLLGFVVDRKGPKWFMMAGILLAALHPITFIVVQDVSQLVPIYILAGLYWVFISSSLFIWQMNLIPEERGVYTGFLNFINGLSWAVGPLLGGFLSEAFGLQVSAFISSGIVLASFSTLFKVPDSLDEQNILMLSQPIRPREIIMSVDKAK